MKLKRGIYEKYIKRLIDIICATIALIILSPVLIIIAILVRIKLGSPVVFKQERIGREEKPFFMYKFRSMSNEKDENGVLLSDAKRLTSFGRKLRSTSLDELPELYNIIKGDLAVVGPRPLPSVYLPYYKENEISRHIVRPGLTGLAQVNGRNSISWDEKFKYDVRYVNNITFVGDIKIILQTILKVLKCEDIGQGEEHPGDLYEVRKEMVKDK